MEEFSTNEKQKLIKNLRQAVAEQKASELGVDVSDIIPRVSDGRIQWIKREEAYTILEKQRYFSGPKKITRSLRGGEDSLINKIYDEINSLVEYVQYLTKYEILNSLERIDHMTSITKIQERTNNIREELEYTENQIDKTKEKDPLYLEAETALKEMQTANEQGNPKKFAELRSIHYELLKKYESRRKALEPFIESARHSRSGLMKEFWRCFQLRWKLQHLQIMRLQKIIGKYVKNLPTSKDSNPSKEYAALLKQYLLLGKSQAELAQKIPSQNEDIDMALKIWDHVLPEMQSMIEDQKQFYQAFFEFNSTFHSEEEHHTRMVYAEKKDEE